MVTDVHLLRSRFFVGLLYCTGTAMESEGVTSTRNPTKSRRGAEPNRDCDKHRRQEAGGGQRDRTSVATQSPRNPADYKLKP